MEFWRGTGEQKTPTSFISACDKFTYTEVLRQRGDESPGQTPSARDKVLHEKGEIARIVRHLSDAVESCSDESGWAPLGNVGIVVNNHFPDFDPRHFGFKTLSGNDRGHRDVRLTKKADSAIV